MKNLALLSIISLLFSSCMLTFNGELTPTNDLKNVQYINTAFGFSEATNYMGVVGNKHDALVLEAKSNMMKNFPLEGNQYYANYVVDVKKKNLLVMQTTLVTVSADIVQDKASEYDENYSYELKSKLGIPETNLFFSIGDTVVDAKMTYYIIESNKGAQFVVKPMSGTEARYSRLIKNQAELFPKPIKTMNASPRRNFVFDN